MQFTLYKTGPVSYYAQVVMPGQYTVDSAYISAGQSAYWGASERSSIQLG
mgnify:FL=1